jgi:hypothetical protein
MKNRFFITLCVLMFFLNSFAQDYATKEIEAIKKCSPLTSPHNALWRKMTGIL